MLYAAAGVIIVLMLFGGRRLTPEEAKLAEEKKNKDIDKLGLYALVIGLALSVPFFYMLLNDML
jgi:hypothetical protein